MNTLPNRYPAVAPRERATALGLASLITLALLAGVGGTADRQYQEALIAQADTPALMAAEPAAARRA